jgi:ADP-ribose pyrophosphatase
MDDWEILSRRPLVSRQPWLELWEEDVRLPGGVVIHGYLRSRSRDFAMVFAVLESGLVPMVSQYKHGTGEVMLDLPAGYLDSPDEPPLETAQRELREETGIVASKWRHLGSLSTESNRGDALCHLYLATGACVAGEQELDATEDLAVSYHQPADLADLVASGAVKSIGSVAGILMAVRQLERP